MKECYACGVSFEKPVNLLNDIPGDHDVSARYSILACPKCGTGRTVPFPAQDELNKLYENYGSRPSSPDIVEDVDFLVKMRRWWGKRTAMIFYSCYGGVYRLFRRCLCCFLIPRVTLAPLYTDIIADRCNGKAIRLLDVGCGSCEFLQFAQSAGVKVVGLEVTDDAAEKGKNLGLDIRAGTIADIRDGEEFNIVRFSHVLEHLLNPVKDLQKARALMGKGGYLMVAVPQYPSALSLLLGRHAHYHVPFHLHHFTRRGLRALIERSGFKVLNVKSKSNSMLSQSIARWMHKEDFVNAPFFRVMCIMFEIFFDAFGLGDSVELHAIAE